MGRSSRGGVPTSSCFSLDRPSGWAMRTSKPRPEGATRTSADGNGMTVASPSRVKKST